MSIGSAPRTAPTTGTVGDGLAHDTILVGFSHSAASAAALGEALGEGRRQGCGVTVLHVADPAERADERVNRTRSPGIDTGRSSTGCPICSTRSTRRFRSASPISKARWRNVCGTRRPAPGFWCWVARTTAVTRVWTSG